MSEIRSVSVHLDADVAGYIAKMKLAGAATDQAFSGADTRLASVDRGLQGVGTTAAKTETTLRGLDRTVNRSGSSWTKYATKVDNFAGKLGILPGLAIAAGAALQPLAVSAAAVAAGFAAPIAFVGGGLTLFALLGGAAIKETNKQLKQIDSLQKKVDAAKKGTVQYAQAQKDLADAQRALTGPQKQYSDALDHWKSSFDKFISGKSGQALLGPIAQAVNLGATILPKLDPIIQGTSHGLEVLLTDLTNFSKTKDFENFVHQVGGRISHDLIVGGRALGSFVHGTGDLLLLLDKRLSPELMRGLGHLGNEFQSWAGSKKGRDDVQAFIDYFHQVGPGVGKTIGSIADALAQISRALAPLSPVTLGVVRGISTAIANIPVPVLTALAGAALGLTVLNKTGLGKVLAAGTGGVSKGGIASQVLGGVQKVFVVNMPGGGIPGVGGPGTPVPTGGPGGGGKLGPANYVNRLLFAPAALAGVTLATKGVATKLYGDTLGTFFGQVQSQLLHIPQMPPAAILRQAQVWDQVFTGHFKSALDILKAPGPHAFDLKKPDLGGIARGIGNFFSIPNEAPKPKPIKEAATAYQALEAHAAKASRAVDQVGPHGEQAARRAGRAVVDLSGRLNSVNGAKAAQAFDTVGHSAAANSARAKGGIDSVHGALNSLPADKNINVHADTGQSLAQLRALSAYLAGIRSKTITVTTNTVTGGHVKMGNARGGYITGPGTETSDSIPTRLSRGEFVLRAAAVRHYGVGNLYAMNAQGYAGGGAVGATSGTAVVDLHGIKEVRYHLHNLAQSLADATKVLDKEKQARANLISQRQSLVSSVQDQFRSEIFGTQDLWGNATDPLSILRGDIRHSRQYRNTLRSLRRRGLSGGVATQITSLADAQQVAGMSNAQLRQLEHFYNVRQRLSHAAVAVAGDTAYGAQIAHQTAVIKDQAADVRALRRQQKESNHRLAAIEHAIKHDGPKATADAVNKPVRQARRRARP